MVGAVIEKVSGLSFEDYLQRNICKPLKLQNTSFVRPPHIDPTIPVRGKSDRPWRRKQHVYASAESSRGDAGLYTTAEELSLILSQLQGRETPLFRSSQTANLLLEVQMTNKGRKQLVDFLKYMWAGRSDEIGSKLADADWAFGLGYVINRKIGPCGRRSGSAGWEVGISACVVCEYSIQARVGIQGASGPAAWIDREAGITVVLFLQTNPVTDEATQQAHARLEQTIYECIDQARHANGKL